MRNRFRERTKTNRPRRRHASALVVWAVAVLACSTPAADAHVSAPVLVQSGSSLIHGTQPTEFARKAAKRVNLRRQCRRAGVEVSECVAQLRAARSATARYRSPQLALADGYLPLSSCESSEAGAMGEHWARVDRIADQSLDPREPEMLLYLDGATGRRLVGVEWSLNALEGGLPHFGTAPPDEARTTPAPAMFGGRVFDGPMQGHNMFAAWHGEFHLTPQPWHYDLHVWLWDRNPDGIFAQYNPALSCG